MSVDKITFQPIGFLFTPFKENKDVPRQPKFAKGVPGKLVIQPEFVPGLKDLEGFSHVYLIFHFNRSEGYQLTLTPFNETEKHGVFATRAPYRPNPLGLSIVRLVSIENDTLYLENVDILDGTPILDIKPYIHEMENQDETKSGWFQKYLDQKGDYQLN